MSPAEISGSSWSSPRASGKTFSHPSKTSLDPESEKSFILSEFEAVTFVLNIFEFAICDESVLFHIRA